VVGEIEKRSFKFREKKTFYEAPPKEKISGRRNREAIAQIPRKKTFYEAPQRKN